MARPRGQGRSAGACARHATRPVYPSFWRALGVLGLVALIAGIAGPLATGHQTASHAPAPDLMSSFSLMKNEGSDLGAGIAAPLTHIEVDRVYRADLPKGFAEEVMAEPSSDFMVSPDGRVVGFWLAGDRAAARESVAAALAAKGWTQVESGSEALSTFAKDDGRYRWLAVAYAAQASGTSVVMTLEGKRE